MSEQEQNELFKGRYVTVNTYAEKCGLKPHAIYSRLRSSESGKISPEKEGYLEQTFLDDAEGVFIDTEKFPPKKVKRGAPVKIKSNGI